MKTIKKPIVFVGRAGAGKTSLVNMFFNSNRAFDSDRIVAATQWFGDKMMKCNLPQFMDDKYQSPPRRISLSQTNRCIPYTMVEGNVEFVLIDTPGMTGNKEEDEITMRLIVKEIQEYNEIFAIVIVLQGQMNRVSPEMKRYIDQLSDELPYRSNRQNIFVFLTATTRENSNPTLVAELFNVSRRNIYFTQCGLAPHDPLLDKRLLGGKAYSWDMTMESLRQFLKFVGGLKSIVPGQMLMLAAFQKQRMDAFREVELALKKVLQTCRELNMKEGELGSIQSSIKANGQIQPDSNVGYFKIVDCAPGTKASICSQCANMTCQYPIKKSTKVKGGVFKKLYCLLFQRCPVCDCSQSYHHKSDCYYVKEEVVLGMNEKEHQEQIGIQVRTYSQIEKLQGRQEEQREELLFLASYIKYLQNQIGKFNPKSAREKTVSKYLDGQLAQLQENTNLNMEMDELFHYNKDVDIVEIKYFKEHIYKKELNKAGINEIWKNFSKLKMEIVNQPIPQQMVDQFEEAVNEEELLESKEELNIGQPIILDSLEKVEQHKFKEWRTNSILVQPVTKADNVTEFVQSRTMTVPPQLGKIRIIQSQVQQEKVEQFEQNKQNQDPQVRKPKIQVIESNEQM